MAVVYVVRENLIDGEYLRADLTRTPAGNEAMEFVTFGEANAARSRSCDRVYVRRDDGPDELARGPVAE